MGLLSWIFAGRFFRRPHQKRKDPVFGELTLVDAGVWEGCALVPTLPAPIAISVFDAKDSGPTDWQRQRFLQLLERFNELRLAMEKPLRDTYEDIRNNWHLSSPPILKAEEIWSVAKLWRIEICGENSSSGVDFVFDHEVDWDNPDHQLNVLVKDWLVAEVAMEG